MFYERNPSKRPQSIRIVLLIRQANKVERSGLHPNVEAVSAPRGLPVEPHFPAVEVPAEANRWIGDVFSGKIIADVANIDVPVFSHADGAAQVEGVGSGAKFGRAIRCLIPAKRDIVIDTEIFQEAQQVFLPLLTGLGCSGGPSDGPLLTR
jgi:hypothetical protein